VVRVGSEPSVGYPFSWWQSAGYAGILHQVGRSNSFFNLEIFSNNNISFTTFDIYYNNTLITLITHITMWNYSCTYFTFWLGTRNGEEYTGLMDYIQIFGL
jgi:hypothetical protein